MEERVEVNNWERTKWTWEARLMELRGLHQEGSPVRQVCNARVWSEEEEEEEHGGLLVWWCGGATYCAVLHRIFNKITIQYDNKTISLSSSKTKSSASQLE